MTIDHQGRPLSLGRQHRLASPDQWIALHVRDRGCVAPGCLACTAHHHLIHDHGWTLHAQPDGTWHLTRPDGTTPNSPRYPTHHPRPP